MTFLILASLALGAAGLPGAVTPAQTPIEVDGDLADWPEDALTLPLHDGEGKEAAGEIRLLHDPEAERLYLALSVPYAVERQQLLLDLDAGDSLDRPADLTFSEGEVSVTQLRHQNRAQVQRAEDGRTSEWSLDLSGLAPDRSFALPASFGLAFEAEGEGTTLRWGDTGVGWENRRLLSPLYLVEKSTAFGTLRGRTAWSKAEGAPDRVLIRHDEADLHVTVEAEDGGFFEVHLPQGRYTVAADDSRTVPSLTAQRSVSVEAGEPAMAGVLPAMRARGNFIDLAEAVRERHAINAVAFAYADEGRPVSAFANGVDPEGNSIGDDALFRMASVSKPVAAMVVLRLAEAGLWDLDEPLSAHAVPEPIADDPRRDKVTTRMVLRHLSGLPNTHSGEGVTFLFDPGTKQHYSGEAFYWLRDAVEAKFGRPFQSLAKEHLFAPAGMTASSFSFPEGGEALYVGKLHGGYLFDRPEDWDESKIVGGLVTTADDLLRFIRFMNDRAGLSDELWQEMTTPNEVDLLEEGEEDRFGLGWVISDEGPLVLSHGGSERGARTFLALLPEEGAGAAVATNASGGVPAIRTLFEASLKRTRDLPTLEAEFADWESYDW